MGILSLDEEEWEQLKQLAPILRKFRQHTDAQQGSSYVTIDKVLPSLMQLDLYLEKVGTKSGC